MLQLEARLVAHALCDDRIAGLGERLESLGAQRDGPGPHCRVSLSGFGFLRRFCMGGALDSRNC